MAENHILCVSYCCGKRAHLERERVRMTKWPWAAGLWAVPQLISIMRGIICELTPSPQHSRDSLEHRWWDKMKWVYHRGAKGSQVSVKSFYYCPHSHIVHRRGARHCQLWTPWENSKSMVEHRQRSNLEKTRENKTYTWNKQTNQKKRMTRKQSSAMQHTQTCHN